MSFLVSDDLIEIELEYIDLGKNGLIVLKTEPMKEFYLKAEGAKKKLKKVVAKFSRADWESFNWYINNTVKEDPRTNEQVLDTLKLRENKFQILLQEMKRFEGNDQIPVILNAEFFKKVNPDLAAAFVEKYDAFLDNERNDILTELGVFKVLEEEAKAKSEANAEKEETEKEDEDKE